MLLYIAYVERNIFAVVWFWALGCGLSLGRPAAALRSSALPLRSRWLTVHTIGYSP